MFEKGFTFQKGAWHARLMKYIWGLSHRDFDYMCPYFWLSVFNVIIAPVVLPVKFTLQVVLWRGILRYTGKFIQWCYEGIERSLEVFGDKMDEWAVEQQRKWESARQEEILSFKGKAIKFLEEIPETVLEAMTISSNPYNWSWDNEIKIQHLKKKHKGNKEWNKMLDLLMKMCYRQPVVVKEIKSKMFEPEINKKADIKSPSLFVVVPETEEQKVERLKKAAKRKTIEDKRAAEKKAKEDEKERIRKLREAEAKEKARVANEKYLLRLERRRNIRLRNKQRINKILKIAKPVATAMIWIVGIAIAVVGLFFLMKSIIWIGDGFASVKHRTYQSIGHVLLQTVKWIGIIAGGGGIVVGLVRGIKYLIENIKFPHISLPERRREMAHLDPIQEEILRQKRLQVDRRAEEFREKVGNVFRAIGNIFPPSWRVIKLIFRYLFKFLKLILITPLVKIAKGIVLFIQIIKQTYNDNCPPITWKD